MIKLCQILGSVAAICFGAAAHFGSQTAERNEPQSRAPSTTDGEVPRRETLGPAASGNGLSDSVLYQGIVDRNAFGLKAMPPTVPDQIAALPNKAKKDLTLTGLVEFGAARMALFAVSAPDGQAIHFSLQEKHGNAWLDLRSVDAKSGTARVLLKQPVVRIQNAGTEVILSFKAHGRKE